MAEQPGSAQDVAVAVLRHGPLPRVELSRRLGLSAGSMSRLSRRLIDGGVLVEGPPTTNPSSGRPFRPLDVVPTRHRFVGVNVSSTALHAVVTDLRATVTATRRVPLGSSRPSAVTRALSDLVTSVADEVGGVSAAGVSVGGHVTPDGVVTRADLLRWSTPLPLGAALSRSAGVPVVVMNDLAALTRAEHWFGAGRGHRSFALVTVGAGVGYGLVVADQVVSTADTDYQLLGHFPLQAGGLRCPDGHVGCATAVLTTRAIEATAGYALGRSVGWDEVLRLDAVGDVVARRVLDDAVDALAVLVAAVANLTMAEVVVLRGEGVGLARSRQARLRSGVAARRDPRAAPVPLVVAEHDRSTWARGAAATAVQHFVAPGQGGWLHDLGA